MVLKFYLRNSILAVLTFIATFICQFQFNVYLKNNAMNWIIKFKSKPERNRCIIPSFRNCSPEVLQPTLASLTAALHSQLVWLKESGWHIGQRLIQCGGTRVDSVSESRSTLHSSGETDFIFGSENRKLPWWQSWATPVAWSNVSVTVRLS